MSARSLVDYPVCARLDEFDRHSGSLLERLIFNHRLGGLLLCLSAFITLGINAFQLQFSASFEKMIPTGHPYIVNYLAHKENLYGMGNAVRIAVETRAGTIFDAAYLESLRRINDEVFLLAGVDRAYMRSLWTPAVRWAAVTEEGIDGGPVVPDTYDGSAASIAQVRTNIERSGEIGQLVAANYRSSIILVPLLSEDPETGKALDYKRFADALETIRGKYQTGSIHIHITGFAKLMGDLIGGLRSLLSFFGISILITSALLYWHTRCVRSTLLVVCCSLAAVVCLLGLLSLLGYPLGPYSVLVPFLVFAIGMSHGAQKMNGIMQDIGRGTHRLVAARYCFRRLFVAGLTALMADAVGFAVLTLIPIKAIQELALAASLGVALLIFTNLVLLPVLLSYCGVSLAAARRSIATELAEAPANALAAPRGIPAAQRTGAPWKALVLLTRTKGAAIVLVAAALLGSVGLAESHRLSIGDLDPGAPELRPDSRYNRDNAFMVANYAASSDILVVMVTTPQYKCADYRVLAQTDALEWRLQQVAGVLSTQSFAGLAKRSAVGMNEGNAKWYDLPRNQAVLNAVTGNAPRELINQNCDLLPLYVYLKDHRADTLRRVSATVERFARQNNAGDARFLLAAGNAGIEAATNIVVQRSNLLMLGLVYCAVSVLCFVSFRSWRAVLCAILPLALTSILCEALMVMLGIGVKVATLPVIALGVGIGVDYGLYVLSVMLTRLRTGMSLPQAYYRSLLFTGRVMVFTGISLAIAVGTWAFSPIKFQADLGILLAFMFVWNLLGALMLLPALASMLLRSESARHSGHTHLPTVKP